MVLLYGEGDRLRPVRVMPSPPEGVPGRWSARPDSLRVMRLEEFDYRLPKERVAQEPCAPRDAARLMVLDRRDGEVVESTVARIGDSLRAGDILVLNDTRVFPALLRARKPSGGLVELLLLARESGDEERRTWRCLASTSRGLRAGTRLLIAEGFEAEFLGETADGRVRVRLSAREGGVEGAVRRHGSVPLPPYIKRGDADPRAVLDRERYQTVYAREEGAVAAPTAGLHFTEELLEALRARGVATAMLTLHVRPGTFQPGRTSRIEEPRLQPGALPLPGTPAEGVAAFRGRRA